MCLTFTLTIDIVIRREEIGEKGGGQHLGGQTTQQSTANEHKQAAATNPN
jgi:hypothetical protein